MAFKIMVEVYNLLDLKQVAGVTNDHLARILRLNKMTMRDKLNGTEPLFYDEIDPILNAIRTTGRRRVEVDRDDFIGMLPHFRVERRSLDEQEAPDLRKERIKREAERKAKREAAVANRRK